MRRFLLNAVTGSFLAGSIFAGGQTVASQNVVSPTENTSSSEATLTPSGKSIQPLDDSADVALDPASLLPDLPELPRSKASLIGGTIARLDRVRDQMTVQVFGGGKMKIAFDTRTHIYQNTAQASVSALRQGDRVYVDTILDGSTVFAKTIRLKTTSDAESQGVIVSYRSDELVVRDMLSPHPLKVRVTSQTQIVRGDHAARASDLAPGTLVAVKFGPQQDGSDVAREVSVLAVPGARFTFVGTVTTVDLRLGLMVMTSSIDHKTYELSLDPSLAAVDDSLHPGADITAVARFDGSRYVARTVTVNTPNQR